MRTRGIDLCAEHKRCKQARRVAIKHAATNGFDTAVAKWIERHAKKEIKRWRRVARQLGWNYPRDGGAATLVPGGIASRWARMSPAEITSRDIRAVLEEARTHSVPGLPRHAPPGHRADAMAGALLTCLSSLFGWLRDEGLLEVNPCAAIKRLKANKRDRVLTEGEIKSFWHAAGTLGAPHAQLLRLLLLLGVRRQELALATRGEFSADGSTWTIPGLRTKNGHPHVVPLAPLVQQILASVPPSAAGDLVFTRDGRPLGNWTNTKRRLDVAAGNPAPFVLHDLRRTAVTHMAEIGIAPHIIEAIVNHVSGHKAGVAGVYNRATYAAEKREALGRWAAHVEGLVTGRSNVVALRQQ
jgi:integrase